MTWVLVMLTLAVGGDSMERVGEFEKMDECFQAYSSMDMDMRIEADAYDAPGDYKLNKQLICVRADLTEK